MMFYCVLNNRFFCSPKTIVAEDPATAAEIAAGRWFDARSLDRFRPVEVLVAEDDTGAGARRFRVTRTVTVTDTAVECEE